MRVIDVYTHIFPPRFFEAVVARGSQHARTELERMSGKFPALVDLDQRAQMLDDLDAQCLQIIALPQPALEAVGDVAFSVAVARIANDEMAELVARHPDRFAGFVAGLPLGDVDASATELARAIDELGALGVQVFSNVNGHPLDDQCFRPIFAEAAARRRAVWLHPVRTRAVPDYPAVEKESKLGIFWSLGWPYETSVAMVRLAYDGIFDRHPELAIIAHHGGAMVPQVFPRADLLVFHDQRPAFDALERSPAEYLRMFYVDTVVASPEVLRTAQSFFGADRLMFGSDMPYTPGTVAEKLDILSGAGFSGPDLEKACSANATRLLGIKPP